MRTLDLTDTVEGSTVVNGFDAQNSDTADLLTLVESADTTGYVTLRAHGLLFGKQEESVNWLLTQLGGLEVITLYFYSSGKPMSAFDLSLNQHDGGTDVTVNLAKLLMLPAISPAEELTQFREMLLKMRAFYKSVETQSALVQVEIASWKNRRPVGGILCRVKDGAPPLKTHEAHTANLAAFIEKHTVLNHWLQQAANLLATKTPFFTLTENMLFGFNVGPHAVYRLSNPPAAVEDDPIVAKLLTPLLVQL